MNRMPIVPDDSLFLPAFLSDGDASPLLSTAGGGERDGDLDLGEGPSLPGFHICFGGQSWREGPLLLLTCRLLLMLTTSTIFLLCFGFWMDIAARRSARPQNYA